MNSTHTGATCLYAVRAASFEWCATSVCRRCPTVVARQSIWNARPCAMNTLHTEWPVWKYLWKFHAKSCERPPPATVSTKNPSIDPLVYCLILEGHTDLTNSLTMPVWNLNCLGNKARWNKHSSNTLEVRPSSNTAVLFMHYWMRIYFHSFYKRALNICNSEHSLLQMV